MPSFILESFNNRELAIFSWFVLIHLLILFHKKSRDILLTFYKNRVVTLYGKKNLPHFLSLTLYILFAVLALVYLDIWHLPALKDTLFWWFAVIHIAVFNVMKEDKHEHFFAGSSKAVLQFLFFLVFASAFYVFSYGIELLLQPALIVIIVYTSKNITGSLRSKNLKWLSHRIFILLMITLFLYGLAVFADSLANKDNMLAFFVPPILTLIVFPYFYFCNLFFAGHAISCKAKYPVKNSREAFGVIIKIIFLGRFRLGKLLSFLNLYGALFSLTNDVLLLLKKYMTKEKKEGILKRMKVGRERLR